MDIKKKYYLIRRAKKLFLKRSKFKILQKIKNLKSSFRVYETIEAPEFFDLVESKNNEKFLDFINKLFKKIYKGINVRISFFNTQRMSTTGTILLFAELDCFINSNNKSKPNSKISCLPSKNDIVNQVLQQVGIFDLLGFNYDQVPTDDTVVHWKSTKGFNNYGKSIDDVLISVHEELSTKVSKGLYKVLTEALDNCCSHAYLEIRNCRRDHRDPKSDLNPWWMFSQLKDEVLTVVCCDLGMGIPRSLQLGRKKLKKPLIRNTSDGAIIKKATQEGETRTGDPNRGKGLWNMVQFVQNTEGATLHILSNRGRYTTPFLEKKDVTILYRDSIGGTIIMWEVPIPHSSKDTL